LYAKQLQLGKEGGGGRLFRSFKGTDDMVLRESIDDFASNVIEQGDKKHN
jgi:hypothetical protein